MTEKPTVTPDRLEQVLNAYGADSKRWPEEERDALLAFLHQSESAREQHRQALELDFFLTEAVSETTAPSDLMGRILQDAENHAGQTSQSFRDFLQTMLKPALGMALATCLGIMVGVTNPDLLTLPDDSDIDSFFISDSLDNWEEENG